MKHKRRVEIVKCKGCNKSITTLINPIFATKIMQDKYSGYCSDCMPEDLNKGLKEDAYNLTMDRLRVFRR